MDRIKIKEAFASSSENEREQDRLILEEKRKGISDFVIGKKYGVSYKYIEGLVTREKGVNVNHFRVRKIASRFAPKDFQLQKTTVWSFKQRGNWATHSGKYRGNWSPYIPRNIILKYSRQGDLVLDYFCGAGTTAVEAKLLGRRCTALDINSNAVSLAKENIRFEMSQLYLPDFNGQLKPREVYEPEILAGDARNLTNIRDNSADLICAHPPYANIIRYTDNQKDDLSSLDIPDFLKEMAKVAQESFRVLKPGCQCAILIGDTRRKKHVIPLGFDLIDVFLKAGFKLKELIIKRQHNCKTTGFWFNNSVKYNFLLLAYEYLPIFEKPKREKIVEPISIEKTANEKIYFYPGISKMTEGITSLETTTVWLFPSKYFEEYLNKNILSRYSPKNHFLTYRFSEPLKGKSQLPEEQKIDLLYIKFPLERKKPIDIEEYERNIKKMIDEQIDRIEVRGFVVVQTKDLREENGYLTSLAKRLHDCMKNNKRLWLKEVIVASTKEDKSNSGKNERNGKESNNEYLAIHHCYLLVYEKVK